MRGGGRGPLRRAAAGRRARALVCAAATLSASAPVSLPAAAWGFTGHRLVSAKAVATLPAELRALFDAHAVYLAEQSLAPDQWRVAGQPNEGPNHFLDLDAFGAYPFAAIARDEGEHRRRHGEQAAARGRVPWRVGEAYADLVAAWRARDAARVLEHAGVLGHYVSDAHVPLHAVLNYDGQLSGQQGLHARWEGELVARHLRRLETAVRPRAAARVADPVAFTLDALRDSFLAAPGVFESDLACRPRPDRSAPLASDAYDDAYYARLYEREEDRLVRRLTAAAEAVGALWRSAWEDAGRPVLDPTAPMP